jgi:hypothetical protein
MRTLHDLREIQPLLLTTDRLFMYESQYKGEETVEGVDCWVLQIRPRQILAGQRLIRGVDLGGQDRENAIVKAEGQAVPQERGGKHENLFPHFRTTRRKVDGHWFPAKARWVTTRCGSSGGPAAGASSASATRTTSDSARTQPYTSSVKRAERGSPPCLVTSRCQGQVWPEPDPPSMAPWLPSSCRTDRRCPW